MNFLDPVQAVIRKNIIESTGNGHLLTGLCKLSYFTEKDISNIWDKSDSGHDHQRWRFDFCIELKSVMAYE
jgi:hypothetical protein